MYVKKFYTFIKNDLYTHLGFFPLRPKVGLAAYLTSHRNSRARHQIRELRPGPLTNRGSKKHFKSFLILCYLVLLLSCKQSF